jgi:hypothetical protein
MLIGLSAMFLATTGGCAAASPRQPSGARISVEFIEPEKFTDARRAELGRTSGAALQELERFLMDAGPRYLPAEKQLTIRIVDVDLAGDFELFRGPQADQVRITRGVYPPRIALEFRLSDTDGKTLREGKRSLTDLDYQLRAVYPREDYLRYEKDLLRDWLRDEFRTVKEIAS